MLAPGCDLPFGTRQIDCSFIDSLVHQRTFELLAIAQPEAVYACSFQLSHPVDKGRFLHAIEQLGGRLLRLKGHVLFQDHVGRQFVETVCGNVTVQPVESRTPPAAFTAIAYGLPDGELK